MTTHPAVSVVLVAVGGYGFHYLRYLWDQIDPGSYRVAGIADPEAGRSPAFGELTSRAVPVFDDLQGFYASGRTAELVVISSPIHWHVPHAVAALDHGSHVLCEKPLAATIQEVAELRRARDAAGRWVMVGYQWSFSSAIQSLRRDIAAGRFGPPKRLRTLCCWARDLGYFRRNEWAGRRRDQGSGRWVLDSPANNAMAHFLHNLFFLVSAGRNERARPVTLEAETYRAFPIENYDTVACRARTLSGVELLFYASHATAGTISPRFRVELEEATASFGEHGAAIQVIDRAGRVTDYGSPEDTHQFQKLRVAIDAVHDPALITCLPEEAAWQTLAINGIEESVASPAAFPDDVCQRDGMGRVHLPGLESVLEQCYEASLLPAEAGVAWAVPGRRVDLSGYLHFPGGAAPGETRR